MSTPLSDARADELSPIERVVKIFLHSKLSLVLILLAVLLGAASLLITPRDAFASSHIVPEFSPRGKSP